MDEPGHRAGGKAQVQRGGGELPDGAAPPAPLPRLPLQPGQSGQCRFYAIIKSAVAVVSSSRVTFRCSRSARHAAVASCLEHMTDFPPVGTRGFEPHLPSFILSVPRCEPAPRGPGCLEKRDAAETDARVRVGEHDHPARQQRSVEHYNDDAGCSVQQ